MNRSAILARESAISAVINGVISIVFFLVVFGIAAPVPFPALALDFMPQAFMVSLMGSLIPAMLLRRTTGGTIQAVALRSLLIAVLGAGIAGGAAYALTIAQGSGTLPAVQALGIKIVFGAALGTIVTPIALLPLLRRKDLP